MSTHALRIPAPSADNSLGRLTARLGQAWCRWWHSDITWPVNGYYYCRKCWRRFPVPWEIPPREAAREQPIAQPVLTRSPAPAQLHA